jgi:hypothetical protein
VLRALVAGVCVVVVLLPRPAEAQKRTPPEATQHALDELANAIAQRRITETATPTMTSTTKIITTNTTMPKSEGASIIPTPTDTPTPTLPDADAPSNAYLRPAGGDWLELALPTGRWLIESECSLTPWTQVTYHTDIYAFVNDCRLVNWQWSSDTPCAQDDEGICTLEYDLSYQDFLGTFPTETPIAESGLPPVPNVLSPTPARTLPIANDVVQPATTVPRVVLQTVVVTTVVYASAVTQVPPNKLLQPTATTPMTPIGKLQPTAMTTVTPSERLQPTATATMLPEPVVQATPSEPRSSWLNSPLGIAVVAGIILIGTSSVALGLYFWTSR